MSDTDNIVPILEEKLSESDPSLEKGDLDDSGLEVADVTQVTEREEFEERLERDEAADEEYLVQNAYEVALKVLSTRDDPELPSLTFRMLFLGLGFSAFGAVLAQIYYFKPQTLLVSVLFLLVLSYWFGNAMAMLPSHGVFRWINPGPFNIKEHVAIIIMSSTAATSATAIQIISVQDLYYNNQLNPALAIFTLIGSQLLGYGYAGLLQDLLVKPTKCFWPNNISTANLFQAFHFDNQMTSKRVRLFWTVFTAVFVWEIIPQWIFPLLTGFSIFCLANNTSTVFRNVFGGASNNEGMGLLSWCFDWNLVGNTGPLYSPIWLQINQYIGIFLTYILMSAVYYGNLWRAKDFPFMSQAIFAEDGSQYNQTALLTDGKFDPVKYAQLGPAFFSATNALYFMTSNLSLGATVSHVFFWHWADIKPFLKSLNPWSKEPFIVDDPHYERMKVYKPIPRWWYLILLAGAYAIAQATNYGGKSGLPWWALTVILLISLTFSLLFAILAATIGFSEFSTSANGFYQMITSYMVPGDPIANIYGALYGQHPMTQCIAMLSDLKLGQYCKLAPRVTFLVQIIGTVVGAILNYIMMLTIINANRADLLSISGTRLWSGQNAQSFNSNGISWGGLGPEMFGRHGVYYMVPICLAIGVFLPLPFIVAHYIWPKAGFENFNTAIILQYSDYMSVGINSQITPSIMVGIFSQWWVRNRYPRWFTKYNYIVTAALDGGTQVISFILNFAVLGASGAPHDFPQWWGNDLSLSADRCAPAAN